MSMLAIALVGALAFTASALLGTLVGRCIRLSDERSGYRQPDGARGKVESVPVHVTHVSAQEARNHVR